MIHYLQLPFQFDAEKMKQELQQLQSVQWPLHYQVKHYEGEWSAFSLRSTTGDEGNVFISPTDQAQYRDTPLLQKTPYIKQVLSQFHFPLEAVRLLKLSPGSIIKEHKDDGLYYEKGAIRLHIPIHTNSAVEFKVDGENIIMKEGECWYCNFNRPHSLANRGSSDRIHLVIDGLVNDWVSQLFERSDLPVKKESEIAEGPDEKTTREIILNLRSQHNETANRLADEMEAALNSRNLKE